MRRRALAALILTASTNASAAEPPSAADKKTCVEAFDRGQRARGARALRQAQSELIVCAQESCPAVLREDCAGELAAVRSAIPTVVLAADDGRGRALTDVTVSIDGEVFAQSLDGRALPVDPGTYEIVFARPGAAPIAVRETFREGEKLRIVRVTVPSPTEPAPAPRRSDARDAPETADGPARRSVAGWTIPLGIAAVGLGSLGVALGERVAFDRQVDDLRASCAPDCTSGQRDDLSSTLVRSNVALGVGVGALVVAIASWVAFSPPSGPRPARAAWTFR